MLGGLILVGSVVLQVILGGSPPAYSDGAQKYAEYLTDKHSALATSGFLHGIALFASFFFFAAVLRRLAAGDRTLAVAAGLAAAVTGALVTITVAVGSALALPQLRDLSPDAVQAFAIVGSMTSIFSAFTLAAASAATAIVVLERGVFERWIGWLSVASAALWLITGLGVTNDSSAFFAISLVALVVWLAWIVALALGLRAPAADAAATTRMTA
jgi:hypothetical protein